MSQSLVDVTAIGHRSQGLDPLNLVLDMTASTEPLSIVICMLYVIVTAPGVLVESRTGRCL